MQLGQHPPAHHVVAHVSDTHLGAGDAAVYGDLHPGVHLETVMARLSQIRPDAIVFTGDIAEAGEPGAYDTVASIVVPAAEAMGAELVWVMGNHDVREPFAHRLLGPDVDAESPLDQVVEVGGLRIIALDSTIPGYHDGALSADQLGWLRDELSVPAPHGTILALHHPPIPTHMPLLSIIELARQHELAAAIDGSDVRTILAGHYHYSVHSMLGSVPVSVASSTCYVVDPGAGPRGVQGTEAPLSFDLVHVYDDRVAHSTVPLSPGRLLLDYPIEAYDHVAAMSATERRERFARVDVDVDSQVLVPRDTLEP